MPGLNGLDATRAIAKLSPRTKTILLTMHKENPYVTEALDAGVHAYVIKSQTAGDLLRAIDEVSANRVYLSPSIASLVVNAYRHKDGVDVVPLTLREREVLQLIAEGFSNQRIGQELFISVKTVEAHKAHIMSKLHARNRTDLIRYALRKGLVGVDAPPDVTDAEGESRQAG
jgi:DNA-binding NarL/FixJ family response regulator